MTGPKEYLSSELDPPLITQSQPIFSAIVENLTTKPNPDDFIARIDMKDIPCIFGEASNEVRFTPLLPLESGNHFATLYFWNPEGTSSMLWWSFRIETSPPEIIGVMWSTKNDDAAVFFDREVEPSMAIDPNRWMVNASKDVFRASIEKHLGGSIVFLPLAPNIFEMYQTDLPMTITYIDVNGPADYVIRRGGSMREAQAITCSPGNEQYCRSITADIFSHNSIQTEEHAVGYYLEPDEETYCPLRIEFTNWSMAPTLNDNPKSPGSYYQQQDNSTIGDFEPVGDYYEVLPLNQNRWSRTYMADFLRRYAHTLTVTLRADCDNNGVFETVLGQQGFTLEQGEVGVDSHPPQFLFPPTVLYGDEAATTIRQLVGNAPMSGEGCLTCNEYYFAIYRDEFERQMSELAANPCDLYIVTQATDDYGRINPAHFCLDKLMSDNSIDYGTTSEGEAGLNALVCDYAPFASLVDCSGCATMDCYNCELDCAWLDPRHRPCGGPPYIGGILKQDWGSDEGAIIWWRLEDELAAPPDTEVVGMKVRVADSAYAPGPPGILGNWRHSEDVMEQLCDPFAERGGSAERKGAAVGCGLGVRAEFLGINEHETDPESPGEGEPKFVHFENWCDESNTTYIFRRDEFGNAVVYLAAQIIPIGNFDWSTLDDVTLKIKVKTSEDSDHRPPAWVHDFTWVPMFRYNEAPPELRAFVSYERLQHLFGLDPEKDDCDCLYIGKLIVCDNCSSPQEGLLYVSSSDNLLSFTNKKDYAYTAARLEEDDLPFNVSQSICNYGIRRGVGWDTPNKAQDQWFGYDDYIQSGGFEIIDTVSARFVGSNINQEIGFANEEIESVPVQSEADVIIFDAHTKYADINNDDYAELPTSQVGSFKYPEHSEVNPVPLCEGKHIGRGDRFVYDYLGQCGYEKPECCKRSDFLMPYTIYLNDFWRNKNVAPPREKDMKWIVLLSCGMMNNCYNDPEYGLVRERLGSLLDTFYKSATGFKEVIERRTCRQIFQPYSDNLRILVNIYGEYPSEPCYINEAFWRSTADMTYDPSVAAFMEAACRLSSDYVFQGDWGSSACGIANENTISYSWHIIIKPFSLLARIKHHFGKYYQNDYWIDKRPLSDNPNIPHED